MLSFDHRGNLTPYELIQANVNEFKHFFVDRIQSRTRLDNFNKYIKYSEDLKSLLEGKTLKQWINGSFVTKKTNPKDIDVVTFLEHDIIK